MSIYQKPYPPEPLWISIQHDQPVSPAAVLRRTLLNRVDLQLTEELPNWRVEAATRIMSSGAEFEFVVTCRSLKDANLLGFVFEWPGLYPASVDGDAYARLEEIVIKTVSGGALANE